MTIRMGVRTLFRKFLIIFCLSERLAGRFTVEGEAGSCLLADDSVSGTGAFTSGASAAGEHTGVAVFGRGYSLSVLEMFGCFP